jgi:hypothetical protein
MTTGEAAARLGIKPRAVRQHIKRGNLAATAHDAGGGRVWYTISEEDLAKFEQTRRPRGRPRKEEVVMTWKAPEPASVRVEIAAEGRSTYHVYAPSTNEWKIIFRENVMEDADGALAVYQYKWDENRSFSSPEKAEKAAKAAGNPWTGPRSERVPQSTTTPAGTAAREKGKVRDG